MSIEFAATWWPVALYGSVLLLAGIAYNILVRALLASQGNALLADAHGSDFKGKISMVGYLVAIPLVFVHPWVACLLYILVAVM